MIKNDRITALQGIVVDSVYEVDAMWDSATGLYSLT